MRSLRPGILFLALFPLFACGNQVVGWEVSDTVPPTVSSTTPLNDASDVALNAPISATFSELMAPATVDGTTFFLEQGTDAVPGVVMYVGVTAIFTPMFNLAPNTLYKATITTGVEDLAGNAMVANHVWTFTTGEDVDSRAPWVTSTNPLTDATNVSINAAILAVFSEAMDPATISGATFTLRDGATPVPGSVIVVGASALFTPSVPLASGTLYTATVTTGVEDLAGNAMAANHVWSFRTSAVEDATAPWVTANYPLNSATNVSIDSAVMAVFSEAMDPLSVSSATFTLLDGATPVSGSVSYVGASAFFTPTAPLDPDTLYTATVTTGAKDLAGNAMAANHAWSFRTGMDMDTAAPFVVATNPVRDATDVSIQASVIVIFSKAMAGATISDATFTLFQGTTPVAGVVGSDGATATFNPDLALASNTTYEATISATVTDVAGHPLAAEYSWSFTTGMGPDMTAPYVVSTMPATGATEVVLDLPIRADFSEAMDSATISDATFTLFHGATQVPGAVTYAGVNAFFTPDDPLAPDTLYTATITIGAKDLAGNPMAASHVWTFTTGPMPDVARPRVTSTVPADDATNVAPGTTIVAIFSEAMDPATIIAANFTVQQLGTVVDGIVTYVGLTATFSPMAPLAPDTTYSVTVTTAAKDLAGNGLAENFVWNFRTGSVADTTRPMVVSTIPEDGGLDVALDTNVSAAFSEAMDPLTLTDISFTLMDGLVPVLGVVNSLGNAVTFNPDADLDPDTEYTATITAVAADLSGNTLAVDHVWNFTTGTALDEDAPTVIDTNPLDLAIDVPLASAVNATFSEDMDPLTITTANFTVTGPALIEVSGQVLYDTMSRIATFTPDDDLLPETLYTATITTGVEDLAGNAMLDDYEWTFSTGDEVMPGIGAVDLGSLTTFVAVAGAGLTNSNSGGVTTLNGDVGLSPTGTCLGDGSPCTITNPVINGTLYANDPEGVAAQAKVDLIAAYVDASTRPVGTTVNDISGMVLEPGVYTSASTMSIAVGGTVTLDGMGDANSVFIFQIGSSLTVNNDAQVLLINGAKAKNVFWAVFASSTLGSNVSFQGSVLAGESNSVGTGSVVIGRLLCTTGQITLLSNTITLPPL